MASSILIEDAIHNARVQEEADRRRLVNDLAAAEAEGRIRV